MASEKDRSKMLRIRNDVILGLSLIAVGVILWMVTAAFGKKGERVTVLIGGIERETYSLSENLSRLIETEDGKNLLVIKDGVAFITEADCPDLICAKHKGISRDGETIVCLPHKLVVRVDR